MADLMKGLGQFDSSPVLAPKAKMQAKVSPSQSKESNSRPSQADSFLSKLNSDRESFQKTDRSENSKPLENKFEKSEKKIETSSTPSPKSDLSSSPKPIEQRAEIPARSTQSFGSPVVKEASPKSESEIAEDVVAVLEETSPAMAEFLTKMEQEFKIKPEDLMKAFTDLSDEDLNKAPEENVEKLVQMLGISPAQQPKAEEMFYSMLKNSENEQLGSYLKQTDQVVGAEVLTTQQLQQKQQLAKLDQMNKDFFIDNKAQQTQKVNATLNQKVGQNVYQNQAAQAQAAQQPAQQSDEFGVTKFYKQDSVARPETAESWKLKSEQAAVSAAGAAATVKPQMSEKQLKALELKQAADQANPQVNAQAQFDAKLPEVAQVDANPVQKASPDQDLDLKIQEILNKSAKQTQAEAPTKAVAPTAAMMAAFGKMDDKKDQSSEQSQDFSQMMGLEQKNQRVANTGDKQMFQLNMNKPTEAQQAQNMNEVIKNAHLIASKGGGEMKIEMKPEGMGELHLKVAVKNGHVNVEMVTESNEAKKMIEKGLGELKSTLAAQKLNVDGIKVDVSNNTQNELQNNFQQNAERQFAHQFLQDFKRENNQWRHGFADGSEIKTPRSQIESGNGQAVQGIQSQSKKSGKRLDLVA